MEDLTKLTVAQLKDLLKERGLPTNGLKADLVKRLQENMEGDAQDPAAPAKPAAGEPVEERETQEKGKSASPAPHAPATIVPSTKEAHPEPQTEHHPESQPQFQPEEQPEHPTETQPERQPEPKPESPPQVDPRPLTDDGNAPETRKRKASEEPAAEPAPAAKRAIPPAEEDALDQNVLTGNEEPHEAHIEIPPHATPALRIDHFTRPLLLPAVRTLLEGASGQRQVETLWMDKIKTHCYCVFASVDQAVRCLAEVQGLRFPDEPNRKELAGKFVDVAEVEAVVTGTKESLPSTPLGGRGIIKIEAKGTMPPQPDRSRVLDALKETMRGRQGAGTPGGGAFPILPSTAAAGASGAPSSAERGRDRERERERGWERERRVEGADGRSRPTLDALFRRTATAPTLYWLPQSEEVVAARRQREAQETAEVEARRKERERGREQEERDRRERERARRGRSRSRGGRSVSRSRSRSRSRPRRYSRSRSRGYGRR